MKKDPLSDMVNSPQTTIERGSLSGYFTRKYRKIQQWMNDYPRRILDYKTPHQTFVQELRKLDLDLAA